MATSKPPPNPRIALFCRVVGKDDAAPISKELESNGGSLPDALSSLETKLPRKTLQRVALADRLATITDDDSNLVTSVLTCTPDATNLRDVILGISLHDLAEAHEAVSEEPGPSALAAGKKPDTQVAARALRKKFFAAEPTAVVQRMVLDDEIDTADSKTRECVAKFLDNQPEFNMRQTSIHAALNHPKAFSGIPLGSQSLVKSTVERLAAVQQLSTTPDAIPVLLKANVTSAFQVSSMPAETFVGAFEKRVGVDEARQIHQHALRSRRRNEHALVTMLQTVRGSGIAAVDGFGTVESRKKLLSAKLNLAVAGDSKGHSKEKDPPPVIDLESMFGSMDYCECKECQSVLSPAAYFVEILQFLRNNNLHWDNTKFPNSGEDGIAGTPLEYLFARRPDLGCLELTCENTNTILPYVDLALEVMESFVVHRVDYENDQHDPKWATIDVYNVEDETSSELLAQPQHTNYHAYCIIKDAVFPIVNAPYHQAIDEARIFLEYLKTSRYELLSTFQPRYIHNSRWNDSENQALETQHQRTLDRAAAAEFWSMTHIDYIAITRNSYWPIEFWEIVKRQPNITVEDYYSHIGRKKPWEYWGYSSETTMQDDDRTAKTGLMFVKKQLLPRSGLIYSDLVDLVETRYMNPNNPSGRDLLILESICFSYKYLKTLLGKSQHLEQIYCKLTKFLLLWRPWAIAHGVKRKNLPPCGPEISVKELSCWLKNWFEPVGKLIVLESDAATQLPIEGYIVAQEYELGLRGREETRVLAATSSTAAERGRRISNSLLVLGYLNRGGTIVDGSTLVGSVAPDGTVVDLNNEPFLKDPPSEWETVGILDPLIVNREEEEERTFSNPRGIIVIKTSKLYWPDKLPDQGTPGQLIEYLPVTETCNIDNVRLVHLDGTPLECNEWDRMQAFIRLYRKLGWTIDETDQALSGLADVPEPPPETQPPEQSMDDVTDWSQILDRPCESCGKYSRGGCRCGDKPKQPPTWCDDECEASGPANPLPITPDFLEQLIAVKALLDLSGFRLVELLTLWTDIPIRGNPSLYSKLFLVHNISAIDPVFEPDDNGNYLTDAEAKIKDHVPILLAAFRIKEVGLHAVIPVEDALDLKNVSKIYRHVLLGRMLRARMEVLPDIISRFGDPFKDAETTLAFVKMWTKIQDRGFTFPQMNYLIANKNDPLRPLGPSQATILKTTKTIFDGLHEIDAQNPDYTESQLSLLTVELVRSKVAQVFDPVTTEAVVALLEGTSTYKTNAPSGLQIPIPDSLKSKLQYADDATASPPRATLTVIGILTAEEKGAAKQLAASPAWAQAIERVGKQAERFFDTYLLTLFANVDEAKAKLLAGDVPPPPPPANPTDPLPVDHSTKPGKRLYLLQGLMPYLRDVLARRLVMTAVSGPTNISSSELATLLLSTILKIGGGSVSALDVLTAIQKEPANSPNSWKGYLIPSATDQFVFYTKGGFTSRPPDLMLDHVAVPFTHQQDDPNDVWFTDPVPLASGKLYLFEVTGQGLSNLEWRASRSPISDIPTSALLPDYSSQPTEEVFQKAYKASLVINNFHLSLDEVSYLYSNAADFAALNFNAVTLAAWSRLADYVSLRDSMPAMPKTLLDLFKWAKGTPNPSDLPTFINSVTNWAIDDVTKLIAPTHLNLQDPKPFVNEIPLLLLQRCVSVKTKIAIDVDQLFKWADPLSYLWDRARSIAESIRKQVRSRYDVDTWEKIAQPLFNTFRGHQRDALIAFLLVQKPLKDWGVIDADSLFEFFLIDVQMGSCLQTSRIKQALSSVQLFIERALMNLEKERGVENSLLDKKRWEGFMRGYRLWQADREVFLWPENWLDPSLRDDKSMYFKALEAKLLQKDVNAQNVQDALKNYLFSVDRVSKVEVIGLVRDEEVGILHIFAKSLSSPWGFFYRQLSDAGFWKPWETMDVDILTYDNTDAAGNLIRSGTYLLPLVWNRRLLVFLPQFAKVRKPLPDDTKPGDMQNTAIKEHVIEFWEIKVGWTEYRNGTWTTKQVTSQSVSKIPDKPTKLPGVNAYQFVPKVQGTSPDTTIEIGVFQTSTSAIGSFLFDGSRLALEDRQKASFSLNAALTTDFHFRGSDDITSLSTRTMYSFQDNPGSGTSPLSLYSNQPYTYQDSTPTMSTDEGYFNFYDPISAKLLSRTSTAPTVDEVFGFFETEVTDPYLRADVFGSVEVPASWAADYNELVQPYSIYHWEVGCHAPMLLMNKFLATQQFEQALQVAHYVFDPFAKRSSPPEPGDIWRWLPFKNVLPENALEVLFAKLRPNARNEEGSPIETWRDNPFQPFVVARSRRQAFMRWFAVQYIKILIEWGDYYFMQNTLETIPFAIQLYVRASHIYGPRPQKIPQRGKKQSQTYNSLLNKWDGFGNAVVQMELAFPFSNQTDKPVGQIYGEKFLANIYGFATASYFCVPNNPKLLQVRDLIDDRLYKIRHCLDINGVFRQLPLFEPPLDPGLLVRAAAAGLSLSSVLNDLYAPMPNFKFYLILQKALEVCGELKSLGGLFLSTKEKLDNETLAEIRSRQEVTMSKLVMQVKTQALTDANLALDALRESRKGIEYRIKHFINLVGESTDRVPNADGEFQEVEEQIETLVLANNPLRLTTYELAEQSKASDANDQNGKVGDVESTASALRRWLLSYLGGWISLDGAMDISLYLLLSVWVLWAHGTYPRFAPLTRRR